MSRLVLVALLLVGACGSPPPEDRCSAITPFVGDAVESLGIATASGVPWTDGGAVTLDLGGQGGFMVQPVLSIDPATLTPGLIADPPPTTLCARVEIDNVDPTGGDRFTGFESLTLPVAFRRNAVTGRYDSPTLANQLRWSPLPPGTEYQIIAVARFEDFAASVTRTVHF